MVCAVCVGGGQQCRVQEVSTSLHPSLHNSMGHCVGVPHLHNACRIEQVACRQCGVVGDELGGLGDLLKLLT